MRRSDAWLALGCSFGVIGIVIVASLVDDLAACIGCAVAAAFALWWPLRGREAGRDPVARLPGRRPTSERRPTLVLPARPINLSIADAELLALHERRKPELVRELS